MDKIIDTVKEVSVVTDTYSKDFLKMADKYRKAISTEYGKVEKSFLNIAFSLHWIYDNDGYKPFGYDNIYDFAKQEYDIARGTTCNFINIVDRFGERDELGGFTGKIAGEYKDYSSSKLLEMLKLTDEEIAKLSPELSVRELKKVIKALTSKDLEDNENAETLEDSETVDSSENTDSVDDSAEEFEILRQVLITCDSEKDYEKKIDKIDEYILRAFKAHPNCKIEISYVDMKEEKEGK